MNWTIFLRQERKENINQRIQEIEEETEGEEDLSGKRTNQRNCGRTKLNDLTNQIS